MTLTDYLLLLPVGLFAGACGGLLGIGGSIVMIPAMVLLYGGDQQHLYQAAAMIVNFFIVGPSVIRHQQARATIRSITRWMIPGAIVGVVCGVYLSELAVFRGAGQGYLQIAFAVFLTYVLIYNVARLASQSRMQPVTDESTSRFSRALIFVGIGLPTGSLGGLLGIGGGLYAVPTQQVCLRIPLRNAIANSAVTMLWSSFVGAAFKASQLGSHGHRWTEALLVAAFLIPTAMTAAWFTARKVHEWPVKVIRVAFCLLLAYAAFELMQTGWKQISHERFQSAAIDTAR